MTLLSPYFSYPFNIHFLYFQLVRTKIFKHLYFFQDTLVQNLPTSRPGFVRGFRKNLGGTWRRLVKRKPETEVYTIPAELKPQLKQIYVYWVLAHEFPLETKICDKPQFQCKLCRSWRNFLHETEKLFKLFVNFKSTYFKRKSWGVILGWRLQLYF